MVNLTKGIVRNSMYLGLPGLSLAFLLSGFSLAFSQQKIEGIVTGKTPQGYCVYVGRRGTRRTKSDDKAVEKI